MKNHKHIDVLTFIGGVVMTVAGLYWLLSSVTVTTGFYSFRLGGLHLSGLVVVPFLIGIVLLFFNFKSFAGRALTVIGLIIILVSIIMGTRFVFRSTSLYSYLLMLVLLFGGCALILKAIWGGKKD